VRPGRRHDERRHHPEPGAPALGLATRRALSRAGAQIPTSSFDDLIGQDAMVARSTRSRPTAPQAWILPACAASARPRRRILARALNYAMPDGSVTGEHQDAGAGAECQAIMESRHVDVLEMDAASHNSVDDIRQINAPCATRR
jgi:DNA polymerase-3 subunit gamma/tau